MATLKLLIETHLKDKGQSARAFAESAGLSYPTLLSLLNKGNVPRKPEHREALRKALAIDAQAWAAVLAASGKDAIDLPSDGPLTLQQLVTKALYAQGFSEQTFAKASGIPYPTVLGITRKGAVPRTDTLHRLAGALGFAPAQVDEAAQRSKHTRKEADEALAAGDDEDEPEERDLASRVAAAARRRGQSIASFANDHDLPYLSLMRLIGGGQPNDAEALQAKLEQVLTAVEPAERGALEPRARSPLHQALLAYVRGRGLTIKAFAEACGLSALTAARLIKHGALPGRATTHDKLRTLLGLDQDAYDQLQRAHQAVAAVDPAAGTDAIPEDEEFEHSETEEIRVADANGKSEHESALHPKKPTGDEDLDVLIARLNSAQRQALRAFVRAMLA